jgi:hypothetical protein
MRHGWSLAWCGWQWDVPAAPGRMRFHAPQAVGTDGGPLPGTMLLRFQLPAPAADVELTDQHVGPLGRHEPIPAFDVDDPDARLLVRDSAGGEATPVPRGSWRFARALPGGGFEPDPGHVWLEGGFEAGRVYDLVYRPAASPVTGAGMLAARDLAAFLRSDRADNPLADRVDHTIATGMSQNSRLLRTLLSLGLDRDESGGVAIDAALMLVGGGRQGEFNQRFAQPSVQPTPGFGHRFPFADAPQTDPRTGRTAGVLASQLQLADPPKLVFVDSAAEYWRGDASLAHTSVVDGSDVAEPPFVRRYLFASTQHGPGLAQLGRLTAQETLGANCLNILDYTPLYRAVLANLGAWVRDGVEPPPSEVPRVGDGTAVAREDVLARLADVPGLVEPEAGLLPRLRPLDLGPDAATGVGTWPAVAVGEPYPCVVSDVDADGNEVAGVRLPDVSVPVATHLGWNPRHPSMGAAGQLLEYTGSTVPFARDRAERERTGDPRPSIDERYASRDAYASQVRDAAQALVARRHLLAEDVDLCVRIAIARYDACRAGDPEPVAPAVSSTVR